VRYRLEHLLFKAIRCLVRLLPRRTLLAAGEASGRMAFRVDRRHRKVALDNLGAAFPGMAPVEAHRIARDAFAFFGRYVFDLVSCLPAFPTERMASFECQGLEHVAAAHAEGKGVLYFTGHFGGWELMAMAHGARDIPIGVIARRLDNPHLEAEILALRASTGNFVIEKRDGFRPMLKALREKKGIAILIDQNVSGDERVFVDFFGRPAATTPALALLHLKTGAPLLPGFAIPLPGDRYRFRFGPPVEVPLTGDRREDVIRVTQACTRVLEDAVREHPSFWLWMHRRWKTPPP
jgi:KDO2-lipid IV(A) lauroyltransferase